MLLNNLQFRWFDEFGALQFLYCNKRSFCQVSLVFVRVLYWMVPYKQVVFQQIKIGCFLSLCTISCEVHSRNLPFSPPAKAFRKFAAFSTFPFLCLMSSQQIKWTSRSRCRKYACHNEKVRCLWRFTKSVTLHVWRGGAHSQSCR